MNTSVPYPDTCGIVKAPRLLCDVDSARICQLSAISDHIYFSLLLENDSPLTAKLFERLATMEAKHFLILGRVIIALGGDPSVRLRLSTPSSPKRVGTPMPDASKMMSEAINQVGTVLGHYQRLLPLFSHDRVATSLLERLIIDEEHYARTLCRAEAELGHG